MTRGSYMELARKLDLGGQFSLRLCRGQHLRLNLWKRQYKEDDETVGDFPDARESKSALKCFANAESMVALPAVFGRGDLLDRCGRLVLSEQMSRYGRVRGSGCRKSRTGYAERTPIICASVGRLV